MTTGTIYALVDPFTDKVRYVGFTRIKVSSRFSQHKHEALKKERQTHVYNWFRSCVDKGKLPTYNILEDEIPIEDWEHRESYWISKFPDLTNQKPGGAGVHTNTNSLNRKASIEAHEIPIVQLSEKGTVIKQWSSIMQASLSIRNKHTGNISRAIKLGTKAYGYLWCTLEDYQNSRVPNKKGKHWKPIWVFDITNDCIFRYDNAAEFYSTRDATPSGVTEAIKHKRVYKKRFFISFSEDIVRSFRETFR